MYNQRRKIKYYSLFLVSLLAIGSCGGSSHTGPNVGINATGNYTCISGCSGTCEFGATTVIQSEDRLILTNEESSLVGIVSPDGRFSISSTEEFCSGQIVGTQIIADCRVGELECQEVTYEME